MVGDLNSIGAEVLVEHDAGVAADFPDTDYEKAGAKIVSDAAAVFDQADVLLKVQPPSIDNPDGDPEIDRLRDGATLIGFLAPIGNRDLVDRLLAKKVTAFSMEMIPRLTRAQNMDALSSMATVAGYKAVLLATNHLGKFFPLFMTAAGTIPPANVFIIGAGVAGLQAIATAKRLGAKVEAFDVRPAVKEQIESLGARFVEMELPADAETKGGYAKEMSEEFVRKEMEVIGERLARTDVCIAAAQVFGKQAPRLITDEMVKAMCRGSVIIDLAAEQGGNCELTVPGETVNRHGVTILGPLNLPASMPTHASQMYSRNVVNLLKHVYQAEDRQLDFEDEITRGACVCHDGEVVSDYLKKVYANGRRSGCPDNC
jgi:NAD(P) transhydrogenase subunit alpha